MFEVIAGVLLLAGGFFVLIAAIGVLRLPDILMRMHASTKAGTLGAGMILLAVAFTYGEIGIVSRAIATIFFILMTAPVAAHAIGRAAYRYGITFWKGTVIDELKEYYESSIQASQQQETKEKS
ncbi:monovalent cation/H(+) antiporter subunit G [Balneolaceae bacterium ANBcel3]|nr:monovalent cation/H(+) antiporter subunit G [Balneolaceae bacterium ANBcel3]